MADSTNGVQIPVAAKFDTRSVDQAVQQMTARINELGKAVAALNKQKFNPVDRAAEQDLRRIGQQFEVLKRTNPELRRRLNATGQGTLPFGSVNLASIYQSPGAQARVFSAATAGTAFSGRFVAPQAPAPAPQPGGGGGGGSGGGGGAAPPSPPSGPGHFPGQGIVHAGLNAAGPVGRVGSSALSAGMSGGLMAGAGALLGGLAALGVGKAVGAVMEKVGDAQDEAIGVDTLKRMLGDVNVGFNALRDSLRSSAEAMNTNYNEALRLGTEFARLSGATSALGVGRDVRVAGGLSRSLGLDLGQGVNAMAQFRLSRVTSSDQDSRRLALMIGEAVGRVGFAKADELLAAVTQYTAQQTRQGMASANVSGYLSSLASLGGSGRPGLDVGGAAALLGRANSAIVGGGAAGEAGQNFLFATLGRQSGLSPVQVRVLQQQGLFGTGSQAFGAGSVYADFAKLYGGRVPGGAAGSGIMNIDSILGGLEQQYGGAPDMLASAAANLLGLNESQAMAVMLHGRGGALNGIQGRLKRSGVSLNMLSDTGIGALAKINSGDRETLDAQAASLRARSGREALTANERQRLDAAMSGGDLEAMRDVLTELTATREQEQTEGKATRDSIEGVARETQKFATALIPVANTIRDGIIAIASKIAPDSEFSKNAKIAEKQKERDTALAASDAELSKFDATTESIKNSDRYKNMSEGARRSWMNLRDTSRNTLMMTRQRNFGSDADYQKGADALMDALISQESGGKHLGKDGKLLESNKGARGLTQVMPGTGTDPGYGVKPLQNDSPEEYRRFGRDYLAAMLRKYNGDKSKALGAYNAGPGNVDSLVRNYGDNWLQNAPAETQSYVSNIMAKSAQGGGGQMTGTATVKVDVVDKKTSKPLGSVDVKLSKPAAAGAAP